MQSMMYVYFVIQRHIAKLFHKYELCDNAISFFCYIVPPKKISLGSILFYLSIKTVFISVSKLISLALILSLYLYFHKQTSICCCFYLRLLKAMKRWAFYASRSWYSNITSTMHLHRSLYSSQQTITQTRLVASFLRTRLFSP